MGEFKFTAEEASFIVEAEGKKLRVSFEEVCLPWNDAQKWCKEHGGGDESVNNLRFLAKYREQINKELRALGKEPLGSWVWTDERSYITLEDAAFVVSLNGGDGGDVCSIYQGSRCSVRAVSAL